MGGSHGTVRSSSAKRHVKLVVTPFGVPIPRIHVKARKAPACYDNSGTCCFGVIAWGWTRAYHTSILVDGTELSFSISGIGAFSCNECQFPTHGDFDESAQVFSLGYTDKTVDELLQVVQDTFKPGTYDLLRKNCNTFTDCAMFYFVGARLQDEYKALESLGQTVQRKAGVVSKLTHGGYIPNPSADDFVLHDAILHLEKSLKFRSSKKISRRRKLSDAVDVALGATKGRLQRGRSSSTIDSHYTDCNNHKNVLDNCCPRDGSVDAFFTVGSPVKKTASGRSLLGVGFKNTLARGAVRSSIRK